MKSGVLSYVEEETVKSNPSTAAPHGLAADRLFYDHVVADEFRNGSSRRCAGRSQGLWKEITSLFQGRQHRLDVGAQFRVAVACLVKKLGNKVGRLV